MGLPPEKYSYKVIGIIMATLIDKLNLHDVSKTMFLTMFARAKETQRERPLFRDLCLIFDHFFSSAAIIFAFLENKMAQKWRTPRR